MRFKLISFWDEYCNPWTGRVTRFLHVKWNKPIEGDRKSSQTKTNPVHRNRKVIRRFLYGWKKV